MLQSVTQNPARERSQSRFNHYPLLAPRIWHGMQTTDWLRLVGDRYLDVHRWPMATFITLSAVFNSFANRCQRMIYGSKIDAKPLIDDPIFILGHWRTGTTLLHEFFALDDRYGVPNTYECFAPRHYILTQSVFSNIFRTPSRRPMDNMPIGWTAPQEDEFALCSMGLSSPYRRIAFPNLPPTDLDILNMNGIARPEVERWKAGLMEFVKTLNYTKRSTLVLKSPPHTGRIGVLLEMFPKARFIHITRNPFDFIPSTFHLWQALDYTSALHRTTKSTPADFVFECFDRMYEGFDSNRRMIPPQNYCEIQFEHLVRSPLTILERVYGQLNLGNFAEVRPKVDELVSGRRKYQRNKHLLSDELRSQIMDRCADYIQRFGYVEEVAAA